MVSSKDTHIVEGAYGTVVSPGIRESEVRWDSMLAIGADYRYRNELEDALIIPVYNDLLDPSGNFQIWTPEPIARIYLDDCVKYIGEDTEGLQYGDLLCVYAMNYSEHELQCIKLSDYNIYTISISDCVLHSTCYPLRKGTRVVVSMVSHYTQKGKAGFILETDYRTCLPYRVKWDDGSISWVIGCTVTTETQEDSIIEESEEDIEIDLISENGFSKEVTFYERN